MKSYAEETKCRSSSQSILLEVFNQAQLFSSLSDVGPGLQPSLPTQTIEAFFRAVTMIPNHLTHRHFSVSVHWFTNSTEKGPYPSSSTEEAASSLS